MVQANYSVKMRVEANKCNSPAARFALQRQDLKGDLGPAEGDQKRTIDWLMGQARRVFQGQVCS